MHEEMTFEEIIDAVAREVILNGTGKLEEYVMMCETRERKLRDEIDGLRKVLEGIRLECDRELMLGDNEYCGKGNGNA